MASPATTGALGTPAVFPLKDRLRCESFADAWFWAPGEGRSVVASSDIAAVAKAGGFYQLDRAALYDFLALGTTFSLEPERTLIKGVRRVPPGMQLAVTGSGGPELQWLPSAPTGEPPADPWTALQRSVREAMPTTGSVAVLCSGGLDSAVLAATLHHAAPERTVLVRAPARLSTAGERSAQDALARHLGLCFLPDTVAMPLLAALDAVNVDAGSPRGGLFAGVFASIGQQATKLGVRALLSGDGADDLFNPSSFAAADAVRQRDLPGAARAVVTMASLAASAEGSRASALRALLAPLLSESYPRAARLLVSRRSRVPDFIDPGFHREMAADRRHAAIVGWRRCTTEGRSLVLDAAWRDLCAAEEGLYPARFGSGREIPRLAPYRTARVLRSACDAQQATQMPRGGLRYKDALRTACWPVLPTTLRYGEKLGRWDLAHMFWAEEQVQIRTRLERLARRLPGIVSPEVGALRPESVTHESGAAWVRLLLLDSWLTSLDRRIGQHVAG